MNGYAGKILKLNLSNRKTTTISTRKYEKWVGGHGMGSAIFFDLVKDKTIDGFDPANVVTLMTSPLSAYFGMSYFGGSDRFASLDVSVIMLWATMNGDEV